MAHMKHNTIRLLRDENGNILDSFESMASEMVRFYKSLIGTIDREVQPTSVDLIRELLDYTLSEGASDSLCGDVTD
ncbi:hypothetical protein V6N13_124208 [Hibiscus sabdariffa]